MSNKTQEQQELEEAVDELLSMYGELFSSKKSYQYDEHSDYVIVYHMSDDMTIKQEILSKESFFHRRLQGEFPGIVKHQKS